MIWDMQFLHLTTGRHIAMEMPSSGCLLTCTGVDRKQPVIEVASVL